jgi:hypothetical protein
MEFFGDFWYLLNNMGEKTLKVSLAISCLSMQGIPAKHNDGFEKIRFLRLQSIYGGLKLVNWFLQMLKSQPFRV